MYEYLSNHYYRVNEFGGIWKYRTSPDGDWNKIPESLLLDYQKQRVENER